VACGAVRAIQVRPSYGKNQLLIGFLRRGFRLGRHLQFRRDFHTSPLSGNPIRGLPRFAVDPANQTFGLVPHVVSASPMCKEDEAHHQQEQEEIILSDHDVLLLLWFLTETSIPLWTGKRCDAGNICV
jgi:hypothetical protein